ncbi:MAG: aldo/keto reductase [Marine Group I thaumarchaeote]|nr:MAG: Aldo/keto reductase [Nitrosopumilales archaeon]GFN39737.1 MAG: aldo/keto reductase [Marine Group I thaumarchaeote]
MIEGYATVEGTSNYAKGIVTGQGHFRNFAGLTLSSLGMGTYLGNTDDATDNLVREAVKKSITFGINVIDTAINYRAQKSERSVGKAITELVQAGKIKRNGIFISTKNGYVTNDADVNKEFWEYIQENYTKTGVIKQNDISSGYHCMTVPYLDDQLHRSLKNLDLNCIDLMYIHNAVEGQQDISRDVFMKKLKDVFEFYEKQRKEGTIRFYGMATWDCFRMEKNDPQYLSLSQVLVLAKQVGGVEHGFKFIQLPFNLYLDQAYMKKNQSVNEHNVSILEAAQKLGIGIFTSIPLMQSKLVAPGVLPEFGNLKPALRALQFIRSTPGVLAPLVGHKTPSHVSENLELIKTSPMNESEFTQLVKKLSS